MLLGPQISNQVVHLHIYICTSRLELCTPWLEPSHLPKQRGTGVKTNPHHTAVRAPSSGPPPPCVGSVLESILQAPAVGWFHQKGLLAVELAEIFASESLSEVAASCYLRFAEHQEAATGRGALPPTHFFFFFLSFADIVQFVKIWPSSIGAVLLLYLPSRPTTPELVPVRTCPLRIRTISCRVVSCLVVSTHSLHLTGVR